MSDQKRESKTHISVRDVVRSVAPWPIKFKKLVDHLAGGALSRCMASPGPGRPLETLTRILIIRPGGIGDAVFLLPVIRAIYAHHPGLEITVLCERRNADVFRSQTDLSLSILEYEKRGHRKALARQSFDAVVDTEQWHYLSAVMTRFMPSAVKVGFGTRPSRAKCFSCVVPYMLDGYELDNFTALFRPLKLFPDGALALAHAFHVPEEARQAVRQRYPENCVALFLGGSIKLRQLTPEQVLAIARMVLEKGRDVILLGGKDALAVAHEVMVHLPKARAHNLVGALTLTESAAVMEKCKLFIGVDSGPLHIAAALNVPLIAIFGPGNWKKWAPRHGTVIKTASRWCTFYGYTLPEMSSGIQQLNMEDINRSIGKYLYD